MAKVNPIQVQKVVSGVNYPASKHNLNQWARQKGASQDMTSTLEQMPGDRYNSPNDVSQAIGKAE
jgi:hypothetical protein